MGLSRQWFLLTVSLTAVILFTVDGYLAAATLLPLIAYLIHIAQDSLRTGFEKVDRIRTDAGSN